MSVLKQDFDPQVHHPSLCCQNVAFELSEFPVSRRDYRRAASRVEADGSRSKCFLNQFFVFLHKPDARFYFPSVITIKITATLTFYQRVFILMLMVILKSRA